jgi:hypothetical protein
MSQQQQLPNSTRIAILECRNIGELLIRISETRLVGSLLINKAIREAPTGTDTAALCDVNLSLKKIADDLILVANHMKELVEQLVPLPSPGNN